MNWKQILYKGVPVLVIAVVIVVAAVIMGRPEPQPKVTKENDTVVDFHGLKVTKGQLYDMMKQNAGLSYLLDTVDKALLAEYQDKIDTKALQEKIENDKATQGEDDFYDNMIKQGVILSRDDEDADVKIEEFYKLDFIHKAKATDVARNELTDEEVNTAKDNYKEELCLISLSYDTKAEADAASDVFNAIANSNDLIAKFKEEWDKQNPDGNNAEEPSEDAPSFIKNFSCEYNRATYSAYKYSTKYRDFVFAEKYTNTISGQEESFVVGDYNKSPKLIDTKYYIVFKLNQAPDKSTYDQTEFVKYITDQLIEGKVTDTYIKDTINEFRADANFTIYDPLMKDQYKNYYSDYNKKSKLLDKYTVATYNLNGQVVKVKADDLYGSLKTQNAVYTLLDRVNYKALGTIKEIQLTKDERADYVDKVKELKTQFLSSGYGQYMTWSQYIAAYYGAFSETDLVNKYASQDLIKRYILGYGDYTGSNPVTDTDIQKAYNEWFSIKASHIFITFDPAASEDADNSKDVAYKKALQIIQGCSEADIDADKCYIEYTYDNTVGKEPFKGLDNTKVSDFKTVFGALANEYSESPEGQSASGDLGYFGPNKMVPEFESAALEIANNKGVGGYSTLPVESEVKTTEGVKHGYHVIYITGIKEKTQKPEGYDQVEDPATSTDTAVKAYYNFLQTIKTDLEDLRTSPDNTNKQLAQLRDSLDFNFNDQGIQNHYKAIQKLLLAYNPDSDK